MRAHLLEFFFFHVIIRAVNHSVKTFPRNSYDLQPPLIYDFENQIDVCYTCALLITNNQLRDDNSKLSARIPVLLTRSGNRITRPLGLRKREHLANYWQRFRVVYGACVWKNTISKKNIPLLKCEKFIK